jgi:PAS domain S-box-containing protein
MAKLSHKPIVFPGPRHAEDKRVLEIARHLSATIGSEFFAVMARHLMRELAADCIYLGEFVGGRVERIRPLAAYMDSEPDYSDYPLAGSAAARMVLGKPYVCRTDAQIRFPTDELLAKAGAKAFVAVPLSSANGIPIGVMVVAYRRSVSNLSFVKLMLDIFGPRASAELSRKQKEQQLRESEQRYKAFIERNADAMWRIEFEQPISTKLPEQEQIDLIYKYGYLAECNDVLARWVGGAKAEQLIGSRVDVLAPRSNPSSEEALRRAIRSEYRFTTVETRPDTSGGKRRYMLRSQWGIVENGMLWRMWGSTRDITELKYSERALNASEQRMADLLESVHLAVVMLNPAGVIEFCNDYFYRLTGWSAADLVGQDWLEHLVPREESARLRAALAKAAGGAQVPLHFESTLLGPEGRRWWIGWDCTFLLDLEGRGAAAALVGRDLTEQKLLETQLHQAQKLESIGRLASGIAHDFNNLLTIIMGHSEALLRGVDPSESAHGSLTELLNGAVRGAELTHQLLAFSRRQVLRPEVLDLNRLILELERMLGRLIGEHIKLKIDLEPALGLVRTDAGQIHQVLLNLALNARDAMPGGGELSITSANVDESPSDGSLALPPGRFVQVTVADTGIGMTDEVQSHLFEPFFTTKEPGKGSGLGLSTAYGIVRQSGGHISVESAVNKGTRVRVFLPRIEAETQPGATFPAGVPPASKGTERILVAEDQAEVRAVVAAMARDLGYVVVEAESSTKALEIVREDRSIELLLTDIAMPDFDGFALAAAVKEIRPEIKTVFMSGYSDGPLTDQKLSDPESPILQKPFTTASLALTLRKVLDRS